MPLRILKRQRLEIILSDFTDRLSLREPWNRLAGAICLGFLLFTGLTGCATPPARIVTIPAHIMAPPQEPTLPKISSQALECLSDEAYEALVIRDMLRKQYSERLYQIIDLARNPTQVED